MAYQYKRKFFPKADHPLFPGRKWIDEHRIIMAEHLGRPLLKTEIVHHKDHNTRNNALSNLELLPWGQHSKLHNTGHIKSASERAKRSAALKGRKFTQEHLQRMSAVQKGKKHSEATKKLISTQQRGVKKFKTLVKEGLMCWLPQTEGV